VVLALIATVTVNAQWQTVGTAGFSESSAQFTSLAFNSDNEPFVAYQDAGNSNKATVMKFDGSNWVTVGTAGFSAGDVFWNSLAFNSDNEPFIAYQDEGNSYKATVMKF